MEIRSYNAELAIANLCFKKIFNNILIERTNSNGTTTLIPVICEFGQRSRVLKNWENAEKRSLMTLPMIVINRTGYSRNNERLNNFNNEVKYEISSKNRNYNLLTPVPIDISYDVTVIAKFPSDIDLIASNFMVMFNNDGYIRCIHPKYDGIHMNNQVVLQDSVSEEHPDEIDGTADDLTLDTFLFVFKTYLFGGSQQAAKAKPKVLSTYLSTYIGAEVKQVSYDELTSLMQQYNNLLISVTLTSEVTSSLTAIVDNPDISGYVYEEFTPIINSINVGFYPVPTLSDHVKYMDFVDKILPESDLQYYVDRLIWVIDEDTKSLTTERI